MCTWNMTYMDCGHVIYLPQVTQEEGFHLKHTQWPHSVTKRGYVQLAFPGPLPVSIPWSPSS